MIYYQKHRKHLKVKGIIFDKIALSSNVDKIMQSIDSK